MSAGYSGTPLAKKLGVKDGERKSRSRLTHGAYLREEQSRPGNSAEATQASSETDGTIWVSWPKKAAEVTTDMTEHAVRAEALPLGLADVKVCAVDNVWSGLKLVIRKSERR